MAHSKLTKIFIKKVLSSVKGGNNEKVNSILKHHPFQSIYASKATLLHYFVEYGNQKMIQVLLERHYDINAQDSTGTTPLMVAVAQKKEAVIEILLSAGADIMLLNNDNKNVLHMVFDKLYFQNSIGELFFRELCKKFSSEEIAQILLDAGCHLYQACYFKNVRIVERMLEHGVPLNSRCPKSKQSALHCAVISEDIDIVKVLLNHKANTNSSDLWGSTPLGCLYHYSAKHTEAKIKLYKILLSVEDVLLTSCDSEGYFLIGKALTDGNYKVIRILLQANIDFTAKDQLHGRNVLHYMALNMNPGVIEELKPYASKCDANAVENSGLSPLHSAVAKGNIEMIQFLLDQKARLDCAQNEHGYTPLYYAFSAFRPGSDNHSDESVELLLQHNAETQLVFMNKRNEQITIFDAAKKTNCLNRTKPVIAHLVILEELGIPITKIISTKIDSHPPLKKYLNKCRKLLKKEIWGSVTLLKLLTSDEKTMARYSGNRKLMLKIISLNNKQHLKFYYSYYHSSLKNRFLKGIRYRVFLDEIAAVICQNLNNVDEKHLVINKIIDFLHYDECLQKLYESSKVIKNDMI